MGTERWVRVLGPVDVVAADGPHPVGGRRQRALLAALAVASGRAVSVDQLERVVWADTPPRTAANTLQSHISHLRGLVGDDAIGRVGHAYRLELDVIDIDSVEFTRLVRRAEAASSPEEGWQLSHDALSLWYGDAFGDLAGQEPFDLEAYRLDELRSTAMEINLAADLALGHHELAVGELQCFVREHPYREHMWRLLVEALLVSGRRVDALRACTRWRNLLMEAGVAPSETLIEMEQRALTSHGR